MGAEKVKRLIPVFEEGSVDDDLLNEGNRNLRDYYQRQGYFDVKVDHEQQTTSAETGGDPLQGHAGAEAAGGTRVGDGEQVLRHGDAEGSAERSCGRMPTDRHGVYSQALVSADISALQAVYQNNGFYQGEGDGGDRWRRRRQRHGGGGSRPTGTAPLKLVYRIEEGPQLRVGSVQLEGAVQVDAAKLDSVAEYRGGAVAFAAEPCRGPGHAADGLHEPGIPTR
jgi:outer membrane protein insertion porin family